MSSCLIFDFSQKYSNRKDRGILNFLKKGLKFLGAQNSNHDNQDRQQAPTITTSPVEAVITDL